MIWLDVEAAEYWLGSAAQNQAFFESMIAGAKEAGAVIGVCTCLLLFAMIWICYDIIKCMSMFMITPTDAFMSY